MLEPDAAEPLVDVIVAVHSAARPVERAVHSVLAGTAARVRVTVVCHGLPSDEIAAKLGADAVDARVRLVELVDGLRSPSGVFNRGFELATGRFTSIMGSDDELEPGAIDSWLAVQARDDADVVIPRLRFAGGAVVPTPAVRPFRGSRLDAVRDRLAYRSAPLGLVSRARFGELRLLPGLRNGGDIDYATRMWTSGARISYDGDGPAYLIHDDAGDRVTLEPKPLADELASVRLLAEQDWLAAKPAAVRRAVAVKLLRIHVFGAAYYRRDLAEWSAADRAAMRDTVRTCLALAPGCERVLARADRALLDALLAGDAAASELSRLAVARRRFPAPATLVPRRLDALLAREAPLRFAAASVLVRGRRARARSRV
ncbi:MAG: glycosyltransferase family 2 protein [Microbacteriaceae bacterium]